MEKQMSFVLKLSLQEMAIRRVVVNFWSEIDVLSFFLFENIEFESFRHNETGEEWLKDVEYTVKVSEEWRETVEKVRDKVTKLKLPKWLTTQMLFLVKPIGSEMLRGLIFFLETLIRDSRKVLDMHFLKQLSWTSTGVINYQETAENIVRLETLDIVKRFNVARVNILVNDIPFLWKELPEYYKRHFREKMFAAMQVECFWICDVVKIKPVDIANRHRMEFRCAGITGNRAATEYVFRKLTNEERNSNLCGTAIDVLLQRYRERYIRPPDFPKERLSNVLCYLLSQMTSEEQKQIFKEFSSHVLICLLDWPWQDLFSDLADVILNTHPSFRYGDLLIKIIGHIKSSGYYLPGVFQDFFLRSPQKLRECFIDFELQLNCLFFSEFFNVEDEESIKVVLGSVDDECRLRFVTSPTFFHFLDGFAMKNKWDMIKVCLRESTQCLGHRERVKKSFRFAMLTSRDPEGTNEVRERQWEECFESLEVTAHKKRSSEDETRTKVKKLCNEAERE